MAATTAAATPRAKSKRLVRENDVLIYAIGVFESGGGRMRTTEEAGGPGLLNDLCEQTGGRHLPAEVSELPDIAAKIGVELRNRYVLGFSPTNQVRDGRYHTLQVKVDPAEGLEHTGIARLLAPRLSGATRVSGRCVPTSRNNLTLTCGTFARVRCLFMWRLTAMTTTESTSSKTGHIA